jgi:hypothetical protein
MPLVNTGRQLLWRDDREAEGARLEIVCAVTGTEGSNPSLSAIIFNARLPGYICSLRCFVS